MTENVKTGNQGIGRLYRICKTIINDPRFTEFIMKHESDIHAHILTFMRDEKVKNTTYKSAIGFLKYSYKMTQEQFRTIFED